MANDDLSDMTESMSEVMSLGGDVQKLRAYYKDWAKTYDDVASHGYGLPSMMVHTVEAALTALAGDDGRIDRSMRVLDAGCGTGLIGSALCDAGFDDIHGVDLSHEMAEQAARRSALREEDAPYTMDSNGDYWAFEVN